MKSFFRSTSSIIAAASVGAVPVKAASELAYFNDFNRAVGHETVWVMPGVFGAFSWSPSGRFMPVGGFEGVGGFSGGLLVEADQSIPLLFFANLPPHDSVSIRFDLALVDRWRGGPQDSPLADRFIVEVGNNLETHEVFNFTFSNDPGFPQTYPGAGLVEPLRDIDFDPAYFDQAYDLSADGFLIDIPTSDPVLVVYFHAERPSNPPGGWPPPPAWAMDNLEVVLNSYPTPVPEVSSLASGTALLALMFWTWRSRKWS